MLEFGHFSTLWNKGLIIGCMIALEKNYIKNYNKKLYYKLEIIFAKKAPSH